MFNSFTQFINDKVWIMIVAAIVLLLLIALIIFLIIKNKSKGGKRITVNDEFITNLITLLGETKNIKETNVDNGRLKITVDNLDLVNLEGIKEIATSGVFVTGNIIKTLFRLDSQTIKKEMDSRL